MYSIEFVPVNRRHGMVYGCIRKIQMRCLDSSLNLAIASIDSAPMLLSSPPFN
jgi:hypothetical protein